MRRHPRRRFCHLPTPLQPAPRLGAWLSGGSSPLDLWIKRDDLTGLGLGGNKVRKLEFLVGRALAEGCDTLLTAGAAQSNHCRQTAAAAAHTGLQCHLALGGEPPARAEGNLLLDHLFGAQLHWCGPHRKGEDLPAIADELRARGKRPYVVPYGGSNPIGALGYVDAAQEFVAQCRDLGVRPTRIVIASSSGGTQAGLMVGLAHADEDIEVTGIRVDKADATPLHATALRTLARETADLLGLPFDGVPVLRDEGLHAAYGVLTEHEREAIAAAARCEGLVLDPVYTGRAFAGLVHLVRNGVITPGQTVVFWHTGGLPALFVGGHELVP